jgi:uncharacterized phosphatase
MSDYALWIGEGFLRLTLVRHGQSIGNAEGRMQGQMDFPLSQQGKKEAEYVGKWLSNEKLDVIYSSDLCRAYETAQEIAKHHDLHVIKRTNLREFHLGPFQGLTRLEIKERFPELDGVDLLASGVEGVEPRNQFQNRAVATVQDLLAKHLAKRVLVVSHGGWISSLLMALLELEWKGKRVFTIGNTSMTTIDFNDPRQFVVVGVNERPHLEKYHHPLNR